MTVPGVTYGEWLRSPALFADAKDAILAAAWGDDAPKSERITGLALSAGASAEAARQQAFLGQAMVQEQHTIPGQFADFIGQVVTITNAQLGYEAGLDVLVLGARDNLSTGLSQVTVLRRL